MPDLRQAQELAVQQRRLILLHFYSDDCPPCRKLDKEVFTDPAVARAIERHFIPVKVHAQQTPDLARQYGVDRWPTDVIITPTGQPLLKTVSPLASRDYVLMLENYAAQAGVAANQAIDAAASRVNQTLDHVAQNSTAQTAAAVLGTAGLRSPWQGNTSWNGAPPANPAEVANTTSLRSAYGQAISPEPAAAPSAGNPAPEMPSPQAVVNRYAEQAKAQVASVFPPALGSTPLGNGTSSAAPPPEVVAANDPQVSGPVAAMRGGESNPSAGGVWNGERAASTGMPPPPANLLGPATPPAGAASTSAPAEAPPTAAPPPAPTANPYVAAPAAQFAPQPSGGYAPPPGYSPSPSFAGPQAGVPTGAMPPPGPPTGYAPPPVAPPHPAVAPAPPAESRSAPPTLGMDGYCPVTLAEGQKWIKGDARFGAVHRGRTYLFTSDIEQKKFLADPDRYSPVLSGYDPVRFAETGNLADGKRAHGVTYRSQVFLFSDELSLQKFQQAPEKYYTSVYQAMMRGDTAAKWR